MFVYNLPNKINGQPFDILAAKNNKFFAFECKNCSKDYFPLSRVEDNQIQAFKKLQHTGNTGFLFVFKFKNEIKFCLASKICYSIHKKIKAIHKDELLGIDVLELII